MTMDHCDRGYQGCIGLLQAAKNPFMAPGACRGRRGRGTGGGAAGATGGAGAGAGRKPAPG